MAVPAPAIEIDEALRLAVAALRRQGAYLRDDFRLTAARADDRWVFWFVFLPQTPGHDVTVSVGGHGDCQVTLGF